MDLVKPSGPSPGAAWLRATRSRELLGAGAEDIFSDPQELVEWFDSQA